MAGMGLSLRVEDFRNLFRHPKDVIVGLVAQMLVLPAIAFGLASIGGFRPEIAVGFVLISACPGGSSSNLINYLLKANVPLSISLTALNGLLTTITIPLVVNLGMTVFMGQTKQISLPFGETMASIGLVVIVPVIIGMLIRHFATRFADQLEKPLRYILPALLLLAYLGVMFFDKKDPAQPSILSYAYLLPIAIALNILSMTAGFFLGRITRLPKSSQTTIAVEVGLQNSALAIFIASTLLGNREMAMVAVVYGAFTFFSTAGLAYLLNRFLR